MVDVRGLTAAYSPSLRPVSSAETEKAYHTDLDAPYNQVMLVGRVLQAETTRTPQEMDTTELDGQVHTYTQVQTRGKLAVEQVIAGHEAYDIPREIDLSLLYVSEDPEDCVEEGKRYLFYGVYDAGQEYNLLGQIYESAGEEYGYTPSLQVSDGVAMTATYLQEDGTYCFVSSGDIEPRFPSFTPISGSTDEFFADPNHELWQKTREEMAITLHSVPFLGTDCLESVYAFQQGDSYLVDGRSFTQEEYGTGAPVCIISEAVAQASGLSVGDRLNLSQYEALMNYEAYANLDGYLAASGHLQRTTAGGATELNNPFIRPYLSQYGFATQEETFTVVGIYRQEPWWDSTASYAMTPNVVFTPSKALAACAYRGDVGGVYLSVVLENGSAQDFPQATGGLISGGQWLVDDQNYTQVQAGVEQLQSAAKILMAACVVGWGVVVLFYLVLYQGGERRNLGIMISVGAGKGRAVRYLVGSGLVLAVVSTGGGPGPQSGGGSGCAGCGVLCEHGAGHRHRHEQCIPAGHAAHCGGPGPGQWHELAGDAAAGRGVTADSGGCLVWPGVDDESASAEKADGGMMDVSILDETAVAPPCFAGGESSLLSVQLLPAVLSLRLSGWAAPGGGANSGQL